MPGSRVMEPPSVVESAFLAKVKIDSFAANDVCRVPLVIRFVLPEVGVPSICM